MADSPVCYRLQFGPLHCAGFIPQPTLRSSANLVRQPMGKSVRHDGARLQGGQSGTDPRRCAPRAARTVVTLPVLADRARALRKAKRDGRETTSGQKRISPRCFARARRQQYGARRCLSPKTNAIAPRGYARCKPPELSVRSVISAPPPLRTLIAADRNNRTHCENQFGPRPRRWTPQPAGLG